MYQRPESIDPGFVDIAPLQLFNPAIAEMGKDVLSKAQERYDASQVAIAKYIEDYGSTPMREADKVNVMNKLQSDLDRLHQEVKTKGVGYADSLPEIIKSLSKARGTLNLAKQDYEKEQALRKQYDAQIVSGKAPRTIGRDNEGRIVEKPMTFEEFSKGLGVSNSGFDETGQYKGYNTMPIRGRGEHDKWIMENVSKPIMQQIIQGDPEIMKGIFGDKMWKSITTKGMSDEGVDIYFNTTNNQTGRTAGDEIVDTFLANSTFAPEEFGGDRELAKEYVKNLVKIQTVKSINKTFGNVPENTVSSNTSNPNEVNPYDTRSNPTNSEDKVKNIKNRFKKFRDNSQFINNSKGILEKRDEIEPKLDALKLHISEKEGSLTDQAILNFIQTQQYDNDRQGALELYKEFYPEDDNVYKLTGGKNAGKFTIKAARHIKVSNNLSRLLTSEEGIFEKIDSQIEEMDNYFIQNHKFLYDNLQNGSISKDEMLEIAEQEEIDKSKVFDKNFILKQPVTHNYLSKQLKSSTSTLPALMIKTNGEVIKADKPLSEILNETGRDILSIDVNPLSGNLDVITIKDGKKETYRASEHDMTTGMSNVLSDIRDVLQVYYSSQNSTDTIPINNSYKVVINRELKDKKIKKEMGIDMGSEIAIISPKQFVDFMLSNFENITGEKVEQQIKRPD